MNMVMGGVITVVFLWSTVLPENESQEASTYFVLSKESVEKLVSLYSTGCVAETCCETVLE